MMRVLIPSMLFLLAGAVVAARPSQETTRIGAARAFLKSFETKDQAALDVISSKTFIQHDARVADGREGFRALLNGAPDGATVRIVRIFADGDYVVAQSEYKSLDHFHQHNCDGEDNQAGFPKTGIFAKPGFVLKYEKLQKVLGRGNFVLMMSEGLFDGKLTAFYDLYRLEDGKQVEHWDVLETIPAPAEWKNSNGKF